MQTYDLLSARGFGLGRFSFAVGGVVVDGRRRALARAAACLCLSSRLTFLGLLPTRCLSVFAA